MFKNYKKLILVICFSLLALSPTVILAAEKSADVVTITLGDIYKEIQENVATKEDIKQVREEIGLVREDIRSVRQSITAIWQTMVGFIALLVITLISIKYLVFKVDVEKIKEALLCSGEFKSQIKDWIKEIHNKAKPIL